MPLPDSSGHFLYYAHAALCLLLAIGLAWQAWRASRGRRRLLRLLASLLAAAALWLTAYPPQHRAPAAAAGAAVLLTPHYSLDSVRALQRRLGPLPLLSYRPATAPGGDTLPLTSLASLATQRPALRQLHVFGIGLPAADVPALAPAVQVLTHADAAGSYFTAGAWPRQLVLGEPLLVRGSFHGPGPVWLRLIGAGAPQDSVLLSAAGAFQLRYLPLNLGPQLARLEARRNGRLIATEPVPVLVQPARRLRLLLLAGTPSFELNLLKNHLAGRGHQVALRVAISRGLQQTDVQNRPAVDLTRLTPNLLRGFDAVVADADALNALTSSEARTLAQAAADGLGVLLTGAAELPRNLPGRAAFSLLPRPATATETPQPIRWATDRATIALPAVLKPTLQTQLLVAGPGAGMGSAASHRRSWGTVLVATPATTFQWLLGGQTSRYDSYWRTLLGAVARPLEQPAHWALPLWARPDEPQPLHLLAAQEPGLAVRVTAPASVPLALRQHPQRPDVWQARYWPRQSGWHRALAPDQDTASFYVFGPEDWLAPLRQQRLLALQQRSPQPAPPSPPANSPMQPWLPAGWYFALFVLAAGWLWLDEKR
ncbi:hypothetical protein EJV47_03195 [Hymenobacter gummosus]|uniref:Aerotolerance regulator N-terminal domain-containing protein n=1 Tax=Hymenobacter gummosus TaxID=1776032 RepID=A0A3S0HCZ0_9BACT|nr:hypothetical protein [Hymenobacter gummosus]RTQ53754.1 hypothetical protein EJV47_03195 [Hymenobacter gummosus]